MPPLSPLTLAIPSKTFLLGEYAALHDGPAILVATAPCFEVLDNPEYPAEFHPDSPAGRYLAGIESGVSFRDPHEGAGGFGASSAQFIASYLRDHDYDISGWELLRQAYRGCAQTDEGNLPSGYDVIAQYMGGLTLIGEACTWVESLSWPFKDIGFILARTGVKVPTHEHLNTVESLDPTSFNEITEFAQTAILDARSADFLGAISQYAEELDAAKLTCESTQRTLAQLSQNPTILAAKGCGCLGADVIALFCATKDKQDVIQAIAPLGLMGVADETQLRPGARSQLRSE